MVEQFHDYIIQNSHIYACISQIHIVFDRFEENNFEKSNTSKKSRQCLGTEDSLQPDMTVPTEWKKNI